MTEEWRPVLGYEGFYEVSSEGRVRSVDRRVKHSSGRTRTHAGRALAPGNHVKGYLIVNLSSRGVNSVRTIHRLVLEAFIRPRDKGEVARHLDGNPKNNSLANLAWGTYSDNAFDAVRHGTHPRASRTHCINGHEYTPGTTKYRRGGARICIPCDRAQSRAATAAYRMRKKNKQPTAAATALTAARSVSAAA